LIYGARKGVPLRVLLPGMMAKDYVARADENRILLVLYAKEPPFKPFFDNIGSRCLEIRIGQSIRYKMHTQYIRRSWQGKPPIVRSYPVYIYRSGQPYVRRKNGVVCYGDKRWLWMAGYT